MLLLLLLLLRALSLYLDSVKLGWRKCGGWMGPLGERWSLVNWAPWGD